MALLCLPGAPALSTFDNAPEPFLVNALSFLDVESLVTKCSRTCKRWRAVLGDNPLIWECSMFELDPTAQLGPETIATAMVKRRLTMLDVAKRLGDSRCRSCKQRGAPYVDADTLERWCGVQRTCRAPVSVALGKTPFINRFFFARPSERDVTTVRTADQLHDAVKAAKRSHPRDWWKNTIVIANHIDFTETGFDDFYSPSDEEPYSEEEEGEEEEETDPDNFVINDGPILAHKPMRICGAPGERRRLKLAGTSAVTSRWAFFDNIDFTPDRAARNPYSSHRIN